MNIFDKFHSWRRKQRWNKQYKSGRWDSLKSDKERSRYQQLVAFLKKYSQPNPVILDIGCGDGVLNKNLEGFTFKSFLGVDFAKVSINKAIAEKYPNSEFIVADIVNFKPTENYDVIIFNEAFYYIHETEKANVLTLMLKHLKPEGIFITSIYREGTGCWEYFKEDSRLKELDFTTVTTNEELRYWKIGVYKKVS